MDVTYYKSYNCQGEFVYIRFLCIVRIIIELIGFNGAKSTTWHLFYNFGLGPLVYDYGCRFQCHLTLIKIIGDKENPKAEVMTIVLESCR
jgi:hypothetical protein